MLFRSWAAFLLLVALKLEDPKLQLCVDLSQAVGFAFIVEGFFGHFLYSLFVFCGDCRYLLFVLGDDPALFLLELGTSSFSFAS